MLRSFFYYIHIQKKERPDFILTLMIFLLAFLLPVYPLVARDQIVISQSSSHIVQTSDKTKAALAAAFTLVDRAELFSSEERAALKAEGEQLVGLYPTLAVAVFTTNDTRGLSTRDYGDSLYETLKIGYGPDYDGVYLLVDMQNREFYVGTCGAGIRLFDDSRINVILDSMTSYMKAGQYKVAVTAALKQIQRFERLGVSVNQHTVEEGSGEVPESGRFGLMHLGGTILSGLLVMFLTKSAYEKKIHAEYDKYAERPAYNGAKEASAEYALIQDDIIDRQVTSVYVPPAVLNGSSSAGRSTVHHSASGRSFGGGGRKF